MERATIYRAISAPTALVAGVLSLLSTGIVYLNNDVKLVFGRPARICPDLDRCPDPGPGRERVFRLAPGSIQWPAVYFAWHEAGPTRNRAESARSDGFYDLVFQKRLPGRPRIGAGGCVGGVLRISAAFYGAVCTALVDAFGMGFSAHRHRYPCPNQLARRVSRRRPNRCNGTRFRPVPS